MNTPVPLWRAVTLAGIAVGTLGGTAWLPPELLTPALRPWTLGLLGLWSLGRVVVLGRAWRQQTQWHQAPVWQVSVDALPQEEQPRRGLWQRWRRQAGTDPGLFLGRAFRWSAQHTQQLEQALTTAGALPVAEDMRGGHPALHAVGQRQERPLVLPWSELVGHVLVAGTTRSGKTRCLEVLAAEAIRAPGAVVVLDPKGDIELLTRCAAEAQRQGRPFYVFHPAFPQHSATLNPLHSATTPAEVATRLQALMPGGGEARGDVFFQEFPLAIIERVATAQQAIGQPWTLAGLAAATMYREHFEALLRAYLHTLVELPADTGLKKLIAAYRTRPVPDPVADAFLEDLQFPREHFQKVTANLIPAFRGVVGPPIGHLLSTLPATLSWERIVAEQSVVVVALASLLLGGVANRLGRIVLQDLTGYLGRRYAYEQAQQAPPLTILIDEFSNVAYPLFIDALNKAGGANARFVLAMQSLADPEAAMGRDHAQRVLDNLNSKIWFRLADARTAEEAVRGLGTCSVLLPEESMGLGYGDGLSASLHRSRRLKDVALVRPEWLMALPRGEALVRLKGEIWKLRVPLLTPPPPDTLARLGLAVFQGLPPAPEVTPTGAATPRTALPDV